MFRALGLRVLGFRVLGLLAAGFRVVVLSRRRYQLLILQLLQDLNVNPIAYTLAVITLPLPQLMRRTYKSR